MKLSTDYQQTMMARGSDMGMGKNAMFVLKHSSKHTPTSSARHSSLICYWGEHRWGRQTAATYRTVGSGQWADELWGWAGSARLTWYVQRELPKHKQCATWRRWMGVHSLERNGSRDAGTRSWETVLGRCGCTDTRHGSSLSRGTGGAGREELEGKDGWMNEWCGNSEVGGGDSHRWTQHSGRAVLQHVLGVCPGPFDRDSTGWQWVQGSCGTRWYAGYVRSGLKDKGR